MLIKPIFYFLLKAIKKNFPQINECKIKQNNSAKYLGVFFDDKLSWNKHIKYIEIKLSAAFGAFSSSFFNCSLFREGYGGNRSRLSHHSSRSSIKSIISLGWSPQQYHPTSGSNLGWELGEIICNFTSLLPYLQHWGDKARPLFFFTWANQVNTKNKK